MQRLSQCSNVGASSPAVTCAAPAPLTEPVAFEPGVTPVIEYVDPSLAGTCAAPVSEYASSSPAAAFAATAPVSDYVASSPAASATRAEATFKISGAVGGGDADLPAEVQPVVEAVAPESTDVTERWGDADIHDGDEGGRHGAHRILKLDLLLGRPSRRREVVSSAEEDGTRDGLSPDSPDTESILELDALSELAGDGCDWVPVRRVQADTSLRLGRLEELFEEWESMGVVRRDDTRLWVAFCPSVADNFSNEDCWW